MHSRPAVVGLITTLGMGIGAATAILPLSLFFLYALFASGFASDNAGWMGAIVILVICAGAIAGLLPGLVAGLLLVYLSPNGPARQAHSGWSAGVAATLTLALEGLGTTMATSLRAFLMLSLLALPIALLSTRYLLARLAILKTGRGGYV
jgi:hypothetical protein